MPNTFPGNLPYPNSFDPVANGAQNIEDLAVAVNDGGGMWKVGSGLFTNVPTVDITGFSSSFEYYRVVFSSQRSTVGNTALNGQFFNGATPRNTNYFASSFFTSYLGTSGVLTTTNNGTAFLFGHADSGAPNVGVWEIRGMNNSNGNMVGQYWDTGAARLVQAGSFRNNASPETNDRIRVTAISGNITGTWKLYGYRN